MKIKNWLLIFGVLNSLLSYAGADPVSWQLNPGTGFPETQIGNHSIVTYTLTSHLPRAAVMVTTTQISGTGITLQDGCNNVSLQPGASCDIVVKYTPTTTRSTTFQLIYGYHRNRIPVPALLARPTGNQPSYGITGSFPNFPSTISPTDTVLFTAYYQNSGTSQLTNCYAGNQSGTSQFILNPSNAAQLQITANTCGTVSHPISMNPQTGNCTISGRLTAPYQAGSFTLSSLLNCQQASSEPSVTSTVVQPTYNLTGSFTTPDPFPAIYYTNQAPFVVAQFVNNGNTDLSNCRASNAQFSLNPSNAATVVPNTPQTSTCGTIGTPVTIPQGGHCFLYGQLTNLQLVNGVTVDAGVTCTETSANVQSTSFDINSPSGACTTVTVDDSLPFPANTYKYADNLVQFTITNTCATDTVNLGPVTIAANAPATATITTIPATYDKCSNQNIAASDSCTVTASVIPTSIGSLTVTASVTPGGGALTSGTTTSTVATNQQAQHHILFVNQCNFDVWYGMANGTGSNCPGPNCITPDPNSGASTNSYHLPAQIPGQAPSTIDLSVASYQNGAFWPRTGCAMQSNGQFNCATGTCTTLPNSGSCQSTGALVQPQSPYTKFEANLNTTAGTDGVYDVSAINGMTVPVEVKAFGPFTPGNIASTIYNCAGAGALIQPSTNDALGNCSWDYDPSSTIAGANINNDFYWVTPGADDGCATSSLPQLCGMAWSAGPSAVDPTGKAPINRRLGSFMGINTLDVFSAYTVQGTNNGTWGSVNLFTKYGLDIQIPNQTSIDNYGSVPNQVIFPGNTYASYYVLIGCPAVSTTSSLNSCYQTPVNNDFAHCCGCVDWSNTTPEHQCGYVSQGGYTAGMNVDWTTNNIVAPVGSYTPQQAVTWIKDACPTAYAYTYDDPSSSFQCTQDGATNLNTSYQVTFCPGGISGLPAGAAEGRNIPPA